MATISWARDAASSEFASHFLESRRHEPSREQQEKLREEWARAVSNIVLPDGEVVRLKVNALANERIELPTWLVSGSLFALTGWNPMGREATQEENGRANAQLRSELQAMLPRPTHVLDCFSQDAASGWREEGFAVRFDHNTAEAEAAVLRLAARFGQAAVYKWSRHTWGKDPIKHSTPVQRVLPTSPRLRALGSQGPVYRVQ